MQKKVVTIIFSCFASIFFWSAAFFYTTNNSSSGLFCLIACGAFTFLAYRTGKSISAKLPDSPEVIKRSTPRKKKWVSQPLQHDAENVPDNITSSNALPPITSQSNITGPIPKEPEFDFLEVELINTGLKSDNGPNKQSLLKAFDNLEPPFNSGSVEAELSEYSHQNKRIYGVYINGIQVGDIPEYLTQYIYDRVESCIGITNIDTFPVKNKEYGIKVTLKFSKSTLPQNSAPSDDSENGFEFVHVKVAGVTFNNDDGESRQEYLHLIKFQEPPFTGILNISLKQFDWKGEVAYAIYVNDCQIGCVPKSQVAYIHDNFDRIVEIPKINVRGGGQNKSGKDISFGAEITLKMRNDK